MNLSIKTGLFFIIVVGIIAFNWGCQSTSKEVLFEVTWSADIEAEQLNGRLLLLIATHNQAEPRYLISDGLNAQLVFGMDVEGWTQATSVKVSDNAFGFPVEQMSSIAPGEYFVQALINRYQDFQLSSGQKLQLPPEKGEGQQWHSKPGNLYSIPQKVTITERGGVFRIELDQVIPEIDPPADNAYVKHIKMQSKLLSDFWGEPVELGAHVLLPHGFEDHPEARYPILIFHGHFPSDFGDFRMTPPDPDMVPTFSHRFGIDGYNIIEQQEAYDFYQKWISKDFPRMIIVEIQHANPYYDDSYAVNSANLGPYGDAITYELIPYIESTFRGIGEGWSRFLYGGSTGGWEALAAQIFYPEEYNGCFAACPDPIDFRAYCTVNIYDDKNAYYYESDFKRLARPGHRDYLGQISSTIKDQNHLELALGNKGRSGGQWDIWEAVYSPQGPDGYPKRLWDKYTGSIDHEVADYWRENYDLRYILERDWDKIGAALEGKIHIYCGDMDNFYLNNAVYLMEAFLNTTKNPFYGGEVAYGDRAEHCWNGDFDNPIWISRLRYNTQYIPKIMERIQKTAPPGADLKSWRY
jgi:hypothetical protein